MKKYRKSLTHNGKLYELAIKANDVSPIAKKGFLSPIIITPKQAMSANEFTFGAYVYKGGEVSVKCCDKIVKSEGKADTWEWLEVTLEEGK